MQRQSTKWVPTLFSHGLLPEKTLVHTLVVKASNPIKLEAFFVVSERRKIKIPNLLILFIKLMFNFQKI
jgi:hypothetical protein